MDRSNEARSMYEKLQSHPNPGVSKKARQFMFSFQAIRSLGIFKGFVGYCTPSNDRARNLYTGAMEMMKVTGSTFSSMNTGYQNYFDPFIRDKVNYSKDETEEVVGLFVDDRGVWSNFHAPPPTSNMYLSFELETSELSTASLTTRSHPLVHKLVGLCRD
ncbi:hypothetical protein KY289_002001 [Solanum tuberosum]|nr:hypothetical protein KY289_002001 [Solanum tuberosum]